MFAVLVGVKESFFVCRNFWATYNRVAKILYESREMAASPISWGESR